MKKIKVLLVDDHQIILDGIKSLLENADEIQVVATANDGNEALNTLKLITIDVILMDIDMPKLNGIDATRQIHEKYKDVRVIMLTMHNESAMIKNLIEIGAYGYLLKNSSKEELLDAICKVAKGEKYFSSEVTMSLLNPEKSKTSDIQIDFTQREIEIIQLLADGHTNKEIGVKLFISHRTVDTHRTNILKKVGVNNVAGLISFAIKNGLVD
ncbi:MAG: DNA-binding response regulator [Marinilabiliales bacterium]|nr:MAG: DNA-binding response regulator [Marinilabiliales bacterium]